MFNIVQKKFTILQFFETLLCLFIIFDCRSIYTTIESIGTYFSFFVSMGTIISLFFCIILSVNPHTYNKENAMIKSMFLFIYLLLFILLTRYNISSAMILSVVTTLLYYFFKTKDNNGKISFLSILSTCIFVVALISLCFWFFGSQLKLVPSTGNVNSSWSGKAISYFGIYFETQTIEYFFGFNITLIRNSAFFTEAPMASYVFSVALLIELFLSKRPNKFKLFIISLSILTTVSTSGIIIMMSAYFLKFCIAKFKNKLLFSIKFITIPIVICVGFYIALVLIDDKLSNSTGLIRLDDFYAGYQAWIISPFFGHGYYNDDILKTYMSEWRYYNTGFSNSPMRILAHCGVYIFVLYTIPVLKGIIQSIRKKDVDFLAFLIIFIVLFTFTAISYQYLSVLLICFCGSYRSWLTLKVGGKEKCSRVKATQS